MTIIPRVFPSAYLQGVSGSEKQRQKQIKTLGDDAFHWLLGNFREQNAHNGNFMLPKEKIEDYFLQKYQGVVTRVRASLADKTFAGSVNYELLGSKPSVASLGVDLSLSAQKKNKFALDLLDAKQTEVFFHEGRHLLDYILNPKILAKFSEFESMFPTGTRVSKSLENFYNDNIYLCRHRNISRSVKNSERRKNIRSNINEFFAKKGFTSNQKIAILQYWRVAIKSEVNAFKDGFSRNAAFMFGIFKNFVGDSKIRLTSPEIPDYDSTKLAPESRVAGLKKFCAGYSKSQQQDAKDRFLFSSKVKILDSMLASEIKAHRQAHALQMRAPKPIRDKSL